MVDERGALLSEPLMGWQAVADGQLARAEVALLVGEDEEDVVRAGRGHPGADGPPRRTRCGGVGARAGRSQAPCHGSQAGDAKNIAS